MTEKNMKDKAADSSVDVTRRRLPAAGVVGAAVGAPYVIINYASASEPIELTVSSSCCSETSAQGVKLHSKLTH